MVSRDIPDRCRGTWLTGGSWSSGPIIEWLGASVGVDFELADELVGDEHVGVVAGADGGGGVAGMDRPDADGGGAGDLDVTVFVDRVVMDPGGGGDRSDRRPAFWGGGEYVGWDAPS